MRVVPVGTNATEHLGAQLVKDAQRAIGEAVALYEATHREIDTAQDGVISDRLRLAREQVIHGRNLLILV